MPKKRTFDWEGVEYGSPEYHRRWRLANNDHSRAYHREYDNRRYKTHSKTETARRKRWNEKNKAKVRVHHKVRRALINGALTRLPCEVCKDIKSIAHHFDYNQPLNVMWLCELHHKEWHRDNEVIEPLPRLYLCTDFICIYSRLSLT
jgi:hypothetical protein